VDEPEKREAKTNKGPRVSSASGLFLAGGRTLGTRPRGKILELDTRGVKTGKA